MLEEAERMLAVDPERMLIKVPAPREGFGVIRKLSDQGREVMATAVPTNAWMILAAAAGARKVAPYSSMLQRAQIQSKMEGVLAMQRIIAAQGLEVELCTGIYHATEIPRYAAGGVRSAFIWEKDVETYLTQELVDQAVAGFEQDWETISGLY
jgi:transaldolase